MLVVLPGHRFRSTGTGPPGSVRTRVGTTPLRLPHRAPSGTHAGMEANAPASTALRHRASELRRVAEAIEHSNVFALGLPPLPDARRAALCRRMLDTNLRQLRAAVERLREVAWRFETRAALLDVGHRGAVVPTGPQGPDPRGAA